MRISDWSSDVCSSDLFRARCGRGVGAGHGSLGRFGKRKGAPAGQPGAGQERDAAEGGRRAFAVDGAGGHGASVQFNRTRARDRISWRHATAPAALRQRLPARTPRRPRRRPGHPPGPRRPVVTGGPRARRPPTPASAFAGNRRTTRLRRARSEEHTSELQSLMRISYAAFFLKKKKKKSIKCLTHITNCQKNLYPPFIRSEVLSSLVSSDNKILI